MLEYSIITPARDEAENLRRLAGCLVAQTQRPRDWIIVDDDSADETPAVAKGFAREHEWIKVLHSAHARGVADPVATGRWSGRDVIAFVAGVEALEEPPDIIIKVDADVSVGPDYFARLTAEFARDPSLGIAGGACYEEEDGVWRERHVTRSHVRGASRAYRWRCFEDVAPLEVRLGWDAIDEVKANVGGWTTRSFRELPFRHHRGVGTRDGARRAWMGQGDVAHYMGYSLAYLLLRVLYWSRRDRAAVAMLWGYAAAALTRKPRYADPAVRARVREEQRLRKLPVRIREALGRARW